MYTLLHLPLAAPGHIPKQHRINARTILIYLPDRVSKRTLCFVEAAGWELHLHPVSLILPPHQGKDIRHTFVDQYTKLSIQTLYQISTKTVVYSPQTRSSAGTLTSSEPPFRIRSRPEYLRRDPGFTAGFNAGILFFHPRQGSSRIWCPHCRRRISG